MPKQTTTRSGHKLSLSSPSEAPEAPPLQQILALLNIPVSPLQNFDQEKTVNIIGNTFSDFKGTSSAINIRPTFNNPIEWISKLHEEKMELYERMLKEKDEQIARLKRLNEPHP